MWPIASRRSRFEARAGPGKQRTGPRLRPVGKIFLSLTDLFFQTFEKRSIDRVIDHQMCHDLQCRTEPGKFLVGTPGRGPVCAWINAHVSGQEISGLVRERRSRTRRRCFRERRAFGIVR
ncbi:hypothetical protein BV392_03205 [Rhodovulum sulfidophilum]|nr:hypothetical protein BV392_03205 [Rhodovulum sulfidophilum]